MRRPKISMRKRRAAFRLAKRRPVEKAYICPANGGALTSPRKPLLQRSQSFRRSRPYPASCPPDSGRAAPQPNTTSSMVPTNSATHFLVSDILFLPFAESLWQPALPRAVLRRGVTAPCFSLPLSDIPSGPNCKEIRKKILSEWEKI